MSSVDAGAPVRVRLGPRVRGSLPPGGWTAADAGALGGAVVAVALMTIWAADSGGFAPETWYWGALVCVATLAVTLVLGRRPLAAVPRPLRLALGLFALYVAWSYASIAWAQYAGLALEGSNRALLYLTLFALMAVLPWRRVTALLALWGYAAAIGVVAVVYLFRFALGDHIPALFLDGRLASPTGYINSTAALYTIGALTAVALAARRGTNGALRGLMLAFAAAELMLAVAVQSRGWLFTLPLVGLWSILVAGGRLRTIAAALLPAAGTLVALRPMLHLFAIERATALTHAAVHAGKIGLLACAGTFGIGTLVCWIEQARGRPPLAPGPRRLLGAAAAGLAIAAVAGGLLAVSGGHPGSFVSRQWHGFTSEPAATATTNHFAEVGSGRYDIWRSALEAFRAHPLGGLGQDNFGDWYLTHRHTIEEPLWTHSLELRLLASTGAIGFVLFAAFLAAALVAAVSARRRGALSDRMLVGAALLPLGVWLIHGSIDWFWEVPALSGPALGFLAVAGRLRAETAAAPDTTPATDSQAVRTPRRVSRPAAVPALGTAVVLLAATAVLGLPYLAVRQVDRAESASFHSASAALADFHLAHQLNPLMSDPGELGGEVALVNGRSTTAAALFRQATQREPGDWIAWMGRGLAASALHHVATARRDLLHARHIDAHQQVISTALRRLRTAHPLTMSEALNGIDYLP